MVNQHFKALMEVFEGRIPPRNLFNFDKLGIQLGGGWKGSGALHFYAAQDKSKYKITSNDLELTTILESVCADGTVPVKLCFVFSGIKHCPSWYEEDNDVL
jgi:hypothetical protein